MLLEHALGVTAVVTLFDLQVDLVLYLTFHAMVVTLSGRRG